MNQLSRLLTYGTITAVTYLVALGCNQKPVSPIILPSYENIKVQSYMKHDTKTKDNPFALENNLDPPTQGIILQGKVIKAIDD